MRHNPCLHFLRGGLLFVLFSLSFSHHASAKRPSITSFHISSIKKRAHPLPSPTWYNRKIAKSSKKVVPQRLVPPCPVQPYFRGSDYPPFISAVVVLRYPFFQYSKEEASNLITHFVSSSCRLLLLCVIDSEGPWTESRSVLITPFSRSILFGWPYYCCVITVSESLPGALSLFSPYLCSFDPASSCVLVRFHKYISQEHRH